MMGLRNAHGVQDVAASRSHEMWGDASSSQAQPAAQMGNTSSCIQVIAVPMGAPPPAGAIPMGPMPPAAMQEAPVPQQHVQMIAVPVGQAPPEGAIPVEQFGNGTAPSPPAASVSSDASTAADTS